jgi:hypothetical protein
MTDEQKKIMQEMLPYFFHATWPVLIVLIIAKIAAPDTF